MAKKYIAYVGSYTYIGKSKGITVLDVDVESGKFTKKAEVAVNNASYLVASPDRRFLYSIADEGIVTFKILPDGNLAQLATTSIRGMRGCYLSMDKAGKYIFVGGYHDGKATVLRINDDGTVGEITAGVFDKGLGSVAERSHKPHINCVMLTPDEKYLCVVDLGIDQIKIFRFNEAKGTLALRDVIHCELDSAPRHLMFSSDGRFMYVVSEMKNYVSVYSYDGSGKIPKFELLQKISTVSAKCSALSAASAIKFSPDESHVFASNAGDNSVVLYERDAETGLLTVKNVLPVSGDYPKDIGVFPDGKHLYSVNHETGTITCFNINYEKDLIIMNQAPVKIDEPNCGIVVELP